MFYVNHNSDDFVMEVVTILMKRQVKSYNEMKNQRE